MSRRGASSIVASPVLVGAVTVLISVVAVMLAVAANKGLPFVPTYDLSVELPGGANLVEGNEVRVGGARVGQIDRIRSAVDKRSDRAVAVVDLKLVKDVVPVPRDTTFLVRPRSPLGLKYVEMTIGQSGREFKPGETVPVANSTQPIEIDEFFSTFDAEFRDNQRRQLKGFGDSFSGRGASINVTIQGLVPFLTHLEPVARNLGDPRTGLNVFFKRAAAFSGQIAPVARTYSNLFTNMGTTFEALGRSPESLQNTIERSPRTLEAGIRSFPVQRPFLRDSETLFTKLIPVADEFRRSLPPISDALAVGRPVLLRTPPLYRRTEDVLRQLRALFDNPNTLLALKDLTTTVQVAGPLVEFVAPYQTVCNYWNYYWTAISEHISEPLAGGTIQRVLLKSDNRTQDNRLSTSEGDRPADIPSNQPKDQKDRDGAPLVALHSQSYGPAIDAQGNADCQTGQRGYLNRLITGARYPPSPDPALGGGSHVVVDSDTPGLAGPTLKGLPNLKDVP